MYKKITTQADFAIVTLKEAKTQCRLTDSFTMDDEYIETLITVCSELAQNYTKRLLSVGTVVASMEKYENRSTLYGGEVISVTSVTATCDDEEIEVTYSFNPISQVLTLSPMFGACSDFMITYECGYEEEQIPKKVKQGVLMMISSMYNNREDGLVGQNYEKLPITSLVLLDSVKL